MDNHRIENMYSIFGDFSRMLDQEGTLGDIFESFSKRYEQENKENNTIMFLSFTKKNICVQIKPYRIDFIYKFMDSSCTDQDFTILVNDIFTKVQKKFRNLQGNRIALNEVEFVIDPSNKLLVDCAKGFGYVDLFGEPSEFNFRINNITSIGKEICNSILVFQQGKVQKNVDQNQSSPNGGQNSIIINSDINTVMENNAFRFEFLDCETYLPLLLKEAKNKRDKLYELCQE